jgi:hypothetical protein
MIETSKTNRLRIKDEMVRLRRSMDFASRHPALLRCGAGKLGTQVADIYQQLGLAWEFLGLQCMHWDGYTKAANGTETCNICGKLKSQDDVWLLLPNKGRKIVGRRLLPNSKRTFPSEKEARLLADSIEFHGAKLKVEVQNAYYSSLFKKKKEITIAADRMVRLREGGIECYFDTYTIHLRLPERGPRNQLPSGAFPWELSRKQLRNFPIILEHDRQGRFVGLTLFREEPLPRSRQVSQNNAHHKPRINRH